MNKIETNKIYCSDNIEFMKNIPDKTIDMIFADPPYNMQLDKNLYRPNGVKYNGINDEWDKFNSLKDYYNFSQKWIKESLRILKDNGSLFIIGSYHNIHIVGNIVQELGCWIINEIVWEKTNPVPNFSGTRLVNSHEIILWVVKNKKSKFTFNYKTMKYLNNNKQMKSVWNIPICSGKERLKDNNGKKIHNTQKPLKLLENIILCSTKYGDVILDPFSGTGTTCVAAKKWGRKYVGIDFIQEYVDTSKDRLTKTIEIENNDLIKFNKLDQISKKISFEELLKRKLITTKDIIKIKQKDEIENLHFTENGLIKFNNEYLTPNKLCKVLFNRPINAWNYIYVNDVLIGKIREQNN